MLCNKLFDVLIGDAQDSQVKWDDTTALLRHRRNVQWSILLPTWEKLVDR
jgi:hypothetical protein